MLQAERREQQQSNNARTEPSAFILPLALVMH